MKNSKWTKHVARFVASMTLLTAPFLVGCGGEADPSTVAKSKSSESSNSPGSADGMIVQNGVGTEPAQGVAIFLDSLRSGNKEAANGVLTSKAREELAKTAYEMQPLGTPEGQFEIGRVVYPYPEDKSVALVECAWSEPPADTGESLMMDIVCEVHQEPEGWRISGLGVSIPGTDDTLVLDFEDAAALQATIDAATGVTPAAEDAAAQAGSQVAADPTGIPAKTVSGTPSAIKPNANSEGLPSYPTLPGYPSEDQ